MKLYEFLKLGYFSSGRVIIVDDVYKNDIIHGLNEDDTWDEIMTQIETEFCIDFSYTGYACGKWLRACYSMAEVTHYFFTDKGFVITITLNDNWEVGDDNSTVDNSDM